jgi:DNA ligase-1
VDLVSHADALNAHRISQPKPYYRYSDSPAIRPDVWFAPAVVWEVKAADLSISPVHKAGAGLVDASKGISLRFPRFMRVREDKSPENATSAAQVAEMYSGQSINHEYQKKGAASGGPAEDDGFEY